MSAEQVQAPAPTMSTTAVNASDPTVAAGAVSSHTGDVSSSSTVSSLADLKRKAPKVYKMMMQGIAYGMIQKMQHDQDHLTQIMKEAQRNSG